MKKRTLVKLMAALMAVALLAAGCSARDDAPGESALEPEESSQAQDLEPEPETESGPAEQPEEAEEEEESEPEEQTKPEVAAANPVAVENLTMRTALATYGLDAAEIVVEITNDSDEDLVTDAWYGIEQYTDYGWQPLSIPVNFTSGPIWLEAGTTQQLQVALYPESNAYTAGRYRVVKEVLPAGITGEEQQRLQIAAEFSME